MGKTEISWTHRPGTVGRSWNPGQGCSRESEGCRNCYAERMAARFAESGWSQGLINLKTRKWNGQVRLARHKLAEPLSWREPSTVFANSMTDLFHPGYTNEEIAAIFGVMAATPRHTYIILTKRAKRMREWFEWIAREATTANALVGMFQAQLCLCLLQKEKQGDPVFARRDVVQNVFAAKWPLPNVWIGVSVESPDETHRIDDLLMTPAAVRLLSLEPLLGAVDLLPWLDPTGACCGTSELQCEGCPARAPWRWADMKEGDEGHADPEIHWVIAGCESGPSARPCHTEWLRLARDRCADYGVPFFLKQAELSVDIEDEDQPDVRAITAGTNNCPGDRGARGPGGYPIFERPYLDGVQHLAFPEPHVAP